MSKLWDNESTPDATTYGKACNRGDFWPNKKCKTVPWADEPTPQTDAESDHVVNWHSAYACDRLHDDDVLQVPTIFARNLERRMRHARRLLEDSLWNLDGDVELKRKIKAHLEAAKKEDGQ